MNLDQLLLKYAAASYDKQMAFADIIGNAPWQFDMNTGMLSFGPGIAFQVQLLGTESTYDNTWLWAWANTGSNIPAPLLAASEELRAFGVQNAIHELTDPSTLLSSTVNGHVFSMIASGFCGGNAYYRGPYEGGALYMLIRDPNYPPTQPPHAATHVSTLFPQVISNLPISDHRVALLAYLEYYGAQASEHGNIVTGTFQGGSTIRAEFMPDNRLREIHAELK